MGRILSLLLLSLSWTFHAVAERYEDPVNGFAFDIPPGWKKMSAAEVKYFQDLLDSAGEQSTYEVGFKSAGAEGEVAPPFLLVQMCPTEVQGAIGQYTSQDIRDITQMMLSGEAQAQAQIQHLLAQVEIDVSSADHTLKPELDEDRKRIFYATEIISSDGTTYAGAILQFGKRAGYQCMYYTKTMNDFAPGALGTVTISSFDLSPDAKWDINLDPAEKRKSTQRTIRKIREVARIGFIILFAGAGLVWVFRRWHGRRT